jgi:hypothetical protein
VTRHEEGRAYSASLEQVSQAVGECGDWPVIERQSDDALVRGDVRDGLTEDLHTPQLGEPVQPERQHDKRS